jgi:hypothetical protein
MTGERENGSTGEPTAQPLNRSTDLVGVALGSIGTGAATGGAAVTLGLLLFRGQLDESLPLVLFAGIVAAAATAWLQSAALAGETWRRAVTAVLAVFLGLLLAFLSAPADRLGGTTGLAVYAALLAVAAGLGARYTRGRARS